MSEPFVTCPDCKGAGYVGGEDFPSSCGTCHAKRQAELHLGFWLSAALDDPNACDEFKADIRHWFEMTTPPERAVNKGYWMPECTALFMQGEL